MKKTVICLLGLALFLLSGTVFATNWFLFDKEPDGDIFIDKDTIIKNGNHVFFWEVEVHHSELFGVKYELMKEDAITSSPRRINTLDLYGYATNGQETLCDPTTREGYPLNPGSLGYNTIDFVLQFAKEGQFPSQKPDISQIPKN